MEQYPTDFNDLEEERYLTALPGWGGSFLIPRVGDVVTLFDADRNTCQGVVDRAEPNGLIYVVPMWDTWADAPEPSDNNLISALTVRAQQAGQETKGTVPASGSLVS